MHGAIRDEWASLGWEFGFLGFPTTNETAAPDGVGRFNTFQGGSVYWNPATGAHEVHGAIGAEYGSPRRPVVVGLGYPTSDEFSIFGRRGSALFQHGAIYLEPATGVSSQLIDAPGRVRDVRRPTAGSDLAEVGGLRDARRRTADDQRDLLVVAEVDRGGAGERLLATVHVERDARARACSRWRRTSA